jgi:hypothetical protein
MLSLYWEIGRTVEVFAAENIAGRSARPRSKSEETSSESGHDPVSLRG